MTKISLVAIIFFVVLLSRSNAQSDTRWLDSLQSVLHNIDKDEMYENPSHLKKYISVNLLLGDYYEKLFEKKELPDLKKAISFYRNITEMGSFHDREKFYKLMAIRNNLCRKLSGIYFFGNGIDADRKKALNLALKGMGNNKLAQLSH